MCLFRGGGVSEMCKRAFAEFSVLICALSVACACMVGVYIYSMWCACVQSFWIFWYVMNVSFIFPS